MDDPRKPKRPWWVWLAVTDATVRRRAFVRQVTVTGGLMGVACAAWVALAFLEGSQLFPYRWWALAGAAGVLALVGWQLLAIRWMDRAGAWQR